MTRWYRAYEGTATDPKLGEVALVAECSRSVVIASWHCLLESAAAVNDGGRFETTARRIAVMLGEPISIIEKIMLEMAELRMIEGDSLCAWKARQFESDSSTERSRKHRATKRNGDATLQEQSATAPYTEAETDTKKKSEAKASSPRAAKSDDFPKPDWAEAQVWSDFLLNRKAKRLRNSPTAYKGFLDDIARIATDEWPPGRLLRHAAAKGWGSINEPDEMKHGQLGRNNGSAPQHRAGGGLEAVGRETIDILRARNGNRASEGPSGAGFSGGGDGRVVALPALDGPSGNDGRGPTRMALGRL